MGAEVLENTLHIKKDLVIKGEIRSPSIRGTIRCNNYAGTELLGEGTSTFNISSEGNLNLLAGLNNDTGSNDVLHFGSANTSYQLTLNEGNLGLGTTSFQAAGTKQLTIGNGTSPGALTADQIYIGAKDSAGTGTDTLSTLQLFLEEAVDATALDAVGTLTTRIPIWVNDVCYWLYLDPV